MSTSLLVWTLGLAIVAADPEALTLDRAIEIALENHVEVIRAKEDLLLADVEHMRALAAILPQVNFATVAGEDFFGNYYSSSRHVEVTGPGSTPAVEPARPGGPAVRYDYGPFIDYYGTYSQPVFTLVLNARQLLFDGGRWWTVIARAGDIERARMAVVALVHDSVRFLVVVRFYDLAKAARGVETFRIQVANTEAQLERAKQQVESGSGKQNDVAAAERNLAADRVTLARRELNASQRVRLLNLALGRDPDVPLEITIPRDVETSTTTLAPLALPPAEDLLEASFVRRPELLNAKANADIIAKNIAIREADFWPTLAVTAQYLRTSRRPDRVYGDPSENYIAQVQLNLGWNLFAGRAHAANVEEGEIEHRKALAFYDEVKRQVRNEVLNQIETMRVLAQVFELNRTGVRAAEEAWRLVGVQQKEGKATLLELRDAEFRLIQAQDALYEARFDLEVAREQLRRVIGADPNEARGGRTR